MLGRGRIQAGSMLGLRRIQTGRGLRSGKMLKNHLFRKIMITKRSNLI